MTEPILVSNIPPELIERWKRGSPDYYQDLIHGYELWAVIRRGGASAEFVRKACDHNIDTLICMYDTSSLANQARLRRSFRLMLREYPLIEELWPILRWRLNEHDNWVKHGLDELDPDEAAGEG
jgi:hypothetical protein